jgi:dTDP-4-dehydrorhamnose reductase
MAMEKQFQQLGIEYWGGIECSINRVRDEYYDQLDFTGHYHRTDDIERLASLGISRLRYPLLWEIHQQDYQGEVNLKWAQRQMERIRSFNIDPIVGLVHHGSGPAFTDLLNDNFAPGLAFYARRVAEAFPWVEYYVPVNEPLTTARFSGLYGFWYPHMKDGLSCFRMLLNQLKAVVLAMREIRKVNPKAKLIQTEDLSKTYSGAVLQYQADFENHRRWLTFDFLCGKVNREHPLWSYMRWLGLTEKELFYFQDNPCTPDICGFNHYLTSERYLDDELEFYPPHLHGGNERNRYVDTEAIRIEHGHPSGLSVLLSEAWQRFRLPTALTEVFLSCTPDEQVRWLDDVRRQCLSVKDAHPDFDFRAITYWALLGEFGWNRLVTSPDGEYECGAFDIRSDIPTETLSAEYIREVTAGRNFENDWLQQNGWWRHAGRLLMKNSCMV